MPWEDKTGHSFPVECTKEGVTEALHAAVFSAMQGGRRVVMDLDDAAAEKHLKHFNWPGPVPWPVKVQHDHSIHDAFTYVLEVPSAFDVWRSALPSRDTQAERDFADRMRARRNKPPQQDVRVTDMSLKDWLAAPWSAL